MIDADERLALEEQRDFLLASLDDLDRERAAGDLDEQDYEALRDDYTARTAAVVRALDADRAGKAGPARSARLLRPLVISAVVVVFGLLAGLVIARNYGQRTPGESTTASEITSNRQKVSQAQQLEAQGDADSIANAARLYDEVLQDDPQNADALTYKGWLLVRAGVDGGIDLLDQAIAARPGFAPPHVFKAVALRNEGRAADALAELDAVDMTQLSAFGGLVTNLRRQLEQQIATGDTGDTGATTTTAP